MTAAGTAKPKIGLVASNDLNRHNLQNLLAEAGYEATVFLNAEKLRQYFESDFSDVDAWLVDLKQTDMAVLELVSDNSSRPLLVSDEMPSNRLEADYQYWRRSLLEKLEQIAIPQAEHSKSAHCANQPVHVWADKIWVLAASLGGPDAVKRFLQTLAPNLPIAMVYAQHIDSNFDQQLTSVMDRGQRYSMQLVRGEQRLTEGSIAVVPVDQQLRFLPFGRVVATRRPWDGLYRPAIDQVIAELARLYREKLGVIVFSGMCNDGEIGVRVAKACGSTVWAQTPESCASADMPEAAIATGGVSAQGTPEQLAQMLSEQLS